MTEKFIDTQYEDLLEFTLKNGEFRGDRTGTGTISYWDAPNLRYDMSNGLPVITTKKVHLKSVIHELLWFLSGDTNVKYLQENGVKIWDDWVKDDTGELGPVYGASWRALPNPYYYMTEEEAPFKTGEEKPTIDQIADLIDGIKNNPESRRHIVMTFTPPAIPYQALPPCHSFFQCYVTSDGKLNLKWYQRSSDEMLGLPFNAASYGILLHMIAQQTDLEPGILSVTFGDAHIYSNHIDQVKLQLSRKDEAFVFPDLKILRKPDSIFDYKYEDFEIVGYESHPAIKAPIAV